LESAKGALDGWATEGDSQSENLVRSVADLDEALCEHLDQEEEKILPLAAEYVSVEEWGMLPGHGMANFQGDKIWLILGLIRENFTEEQRALMLANMPPPAVQMWESMGEASFDEMIGEVRATR
jgi:hypothetical protein